VHNGAFCLDRLSGGLTSVTSMHHSTDRGGGGRIKPQVSYRMHPGSVHPGMGLLRLRPGPCARDLAVLVEGTLVTSSTFVSRGRGGGAVATLVLSREDPWAHRQGMGTCVAIAL